MEGQISVPLMLKQALEAPVFVLYQIRSSKVVFTLQPAQAGFVRIASGLQPAGFYRPLTTGFGITL